MALLHHPLPSLAFSSGLVSSLKVNKSTPRHRTAPLSATSAILQRHSATASQPSYTRIRVSRQLSAATSPTKRRHGNPSTTTTTTTRASSLDDEEANGVPNGGWWWGEKSGPSAAERDKLFVSGSMDTMSLDLDDGLGPLRAASRRAPLTDPLVPRDVAPTDVPWCLGASSMLKVGEVKSVTTFLSDAPFALYRGKDGVAHAIEDVCPHRGARLSQGTVRGDCVACPYHGWEFNGDGKVVYVPSNANRTTPKNADVAALTIREHGGFIWAVPPGYGPTDPMPSENQPELSDPKWGRVYGSKVVAGNYVDWVQNAMDISHINYVHEFADENAGEVHAMKVHVGAVRGSQDAVTCTASVHPKPASVFTAPMQVKLCPIKSVFGLPGTSMVTIALRNPLEFVTVTSVTPIDQHTSLLTWCFANNLPWPVNHLAGVAAFDAETYKAIAQDESVISNLVELPAAAPAVNVPADMYQLKGMKQLRLMLERSEQKGAVRVLRGGTGVAAAILEGGEIGGASGRGGGGSGSGAPGYTTGKQWGVGGGGGGAEKPKLKGGIGAR